MERFEFSLLEEDFSEPELTNTEKAMLREYAEPGGPLWKIMRKMAQYRRGLIEGVGERFASIDLDDPQERKDLKKIQVTATAIEWLQEQLEENLTPHSAEEDEERNANEHD